MVPRQPIRKYRSEALFITNFICETKCIFQLIWEVKRLERVLLCKLKILKVYFAPKILFIILGTVEDVLYHIYCWWCRSWDKKHPQRVILWDFFLSYEKYVSKMNFKNILKLRSFLLIRKYNSEAWYIFECTSDFKCICW